MTEHPSDKASHKKIITQPVEMISLLRSKKGYEERPKMEASVYALCCQQIDLIYDKIGILLEIGYS